MNSNTTTAPLILPVIHYANDAQALRNADIAVSAGCEGVFLIHMDGHDRAILGVARDIKLRWPKMLVGINLLNSRPIDALRVSLARGLDMTWTDQQVTYSTDAPWNEARALRSISADQHVFVGVGFKYQRPDPYPAEAARKAVRFGLIPTTSGPATGMPADPAAVAALREAIGFAGPLAIASGITPDNAGAFSPYVSHMLVATGVSTNFHALDPVKLAALRAAIGSAS